MLKEFQVGIFPQYFQASHHIEEKSVFIYLQLREETSNVIVIGHKQGMNWTLGKKKCPTGQKRVNQKTNQWNTSVFFPSLF